MAWGRAAGVDGKVFVLSCQPPVDIPTLMACRHLSTPVKWNTLFTPFQPILSAAPNLMCGITIFLNIYTRNLSHLKCFLFSQLYASHSAGHIWKLDSFLFIPYLCSLLALSHSSITAWVFHWSPFLDSSSFQSSFTQPINFLNPENGSEIVCAIFFFLERACSFR